jgi:hypothetical protein
VRAIDLLEVCDFVYHIVMKAGFAEVELMLAVAHEDFLVFLLDLVDLSLANFAYGDVFEFLEGVEEASSHHVTDSRFAHLFTSDESTRAS